MKYQFDNLRKMKGLILVLFCALTFVTVVYGKNNFNFSIFWTTTWRGLLKKCYSRFYVFKTKTSTGNAVSCLSGRKLNLNRSPGAGFFTPRGLLKTSVEAQFLSGDSNCYSYAKSNYWNLKFIFKLTFNFEFICFVLHLFYWVLYQLIYLW